MNELQSATTPLRLVPDGLNHPDFGGLDVDLLRFRLEASLALPAVVAITSATAGDGKELVARSLAHSLASAGYGTLLIVTKLTGRTLIDAPLGIVIPGIGRLHLAPDVASGKLAVLTVTDPTLLRSTSRGEMKAAIEKLRGRFEAVEILRGRFECVVVSPDAGTSNAFASAMLATADAVFVSVAKKRRETPNDKRLIAELERRGPRFMGLVAVDPAVIAAKSAASLPGMQAPPLNRAQIPKPNLIARIIRAAIRGIRVGRRDHVAQDAPLLKPATSEPQAPVLPGGASIAIRPRQAQ